MDLYIERPHILYSRVARIFGLNQGSIEIAAEKRGEHGHRLSYITDLDFRVEKHFQLSDTIRLRGFFEVFNVLNSDNPCGFWSRTWAPGEDFSLIISSRREEQWSE
ncbi:hypothetical protein CEE39_07750 [bacterium (candidate division B38) B3_B38]|nr:MAG: hypothetical protein CEE39_07750 [bacterium (candidate division B38) B3_B38]